VCVCVCVCIHTHTWHIQGRGDAPTRGTITPT
jgi:hypothetical protein